VGVISRVDWWRPQWPTKWALAVAEGPGEPVGLETFPGLEIAVLVAGDVPVPDVFFEHPAAATATTTVATTATTNPGLTETFSGMWQSLQMGYALKNLRLMPIFHLDARNSDLAPPKPLYPHTQLIFHHAEKLPCEEYGVDMKCIWETHADSDLMLQCAQQLPRWAGAPRPAACWPHQPLG